MKAGLILGGNGALGRAMVSTFKKRGWKVVSLDFGANTEADTNVIVDAGLPMK
jgi:NAD(P)-dependent dehydrogenase (short-subunit alcohol dehydrogenase family)